MVRVSERALSLSFTLEPWDFHRLYHHGNPMNFLSFLGFPGEMALVPSEPARAHSVGVHELAHLLLWSLTGPPSATDPLLVVIPTIGWLVTSIVTYAQ